MNPTLFSWRIRERLRLTVLRFGLLGFGLLGFGLLSQALFANLAWAEAPYTHIDAGQLQRLLASGVPVYDLRRSDEREQTGFIPGSRALTFRDRDGSGLKSFLTRLQAETPPEQALILVCQSGQRSVEAAYELEALGYEQVYNLKGGIDAWRDALPWAPPQ